MAQGRQQDLDPNKPIAPPALSQYLRSSKWRYALVIIIPNLLFWAAAYGELCLSLLILPLAIAVLLWWLRINNIWHQLALGVVALSIATIVLAAALFTIIGTTNEGLSSSDGVITNGMVTPATGTSSTDFVFNITVTNLGKNSNVTANVIIGEISAFNSNYENKSMVLTSNGTINGKAVWNFSSTTRVGAPINNYAFIVNGNGIWHVTPSASGPFYSDSAAIFGVLTGISLGYIFPISLTQFIVMLLFLRFSGKSREAREKMMKDYQQKKAERESLPAGKEGGPKKTSTTSAEEMFVCSECGADVPASAKFCPSCGEPFEEEEPKINVGTEQKKGKN